MPRDWESVLCSWGNPPSQTEQQKAENAETAIRKALKACPRLAAMSLEVFAQGSYKNRTNVRQDSDVDICVLYKDTFFTDYSLAEGLSRGSTNVVESTYSYAEFKTEVGKALVDFFGTEFVTRGNKAFDIHKNSYRIDADVVPCFEHRRYMGKPGSYHFNAGTELRPDKGGSIINWPKQNYDNGVAKNGRTSRQFKAITRILKRLRYELIDEGHEKAEDVPSYLLECLAWNIPDDHFGAATQKGNVRNALAYLWNNTRQQEQCKEWGEVNELKYLFRTSQPWTRENVNNFLQIAWDHIGYK
jgi:predicted nucleotidyltransferase